MNEQVTGSAALQGKEIERLAREYAEFVLDKAGHNNPLAYEVREDIVEDAVSTFKWLLRDHCIVKKSEVIEKHRHAKKMQNSKSAPSSCAGSCMAATLEELFGADLFKNDTDNGNN